MGKVKRVRVDEPKPVQRWFVCRLYSSGLIRDGEYMTREEAVEEAQRVAGFGGPPAVVLEGFIL